MAQHQRIDGQGGANVQILLSAMDGDWRAPVEPVDLTSRGARLRQQIDQPVPAAVGAHLTVWLCDPGTGVELPIEARLVHRREEPDGRILGVDFVDLRSVGGLLHPVLGRVMNRRAAFRVTPSKSGGPIAVTLAGPPDLDLPLEVGVLVDVSTGGLAVDVPVSFEVAMGGYDHVECMFRLPGIPHSLGVTARILHRTLKGEDTVRYGVQFLGSDSPTFRATHDALLGYVIRRQQQMAEEHELMHGTGIPLGALKPVR